jgi:hypothetical protein
VALSGWAPRSLDATPERELARRVAEIGMGDEREELARDAEGADAVGGAPGDRAQERRDVVEGQLGEEEELLASRLLPDEARRRRAEGDRLVEERAAQAETHRSSTCSSRAYVVQRTGRLTARRRTR